jgi:hypothetical protein
MSANVTIWKRDCHFQSKGNCCHKILLTMWTNNADSALINSRQIRGRFPSNFIWGIERFWRWRVIISWDVTPCSAAELLVDYMRLSLQPQYTVSWKATGCLQMSTKGNGNCKQFGKNDQKETQYRTQPCVLCIFNICTFMKAEYSTHALLQLSTTNAFDLLLTISVHCIATIHVQSSSALLVTSYTWRRVDWYGDNITEQLAATIFRAYSVLL